MTQNRNGTENDVVNQEGQAEAGEVVKLDLDKLSAHLLLTGTVGSGKSVSIAYALRALMADPERKIGVLPLEPEGSMEDGLSGIDEMDAADGGTAQQPACADDAGCPE